MNHLTEKFLKAITGFTGRFTGAYSLRENGRCAELHSTPYVRITLKENREGLDIHILPGCEGETITIPACVTKEGIDDLAFNDFYVAAGAKATIVAGCGVHTEEGSPARHSGIHRFFLEPGAQIHYIEKHLGTGGSAPRSIDPETVAQLGEGATLQMDTAQLGGLDRSTRTTRAVLAAGARLTVHEGLLTEGVQQATSRFTVQLDGPGAAADLISRSVAKDDSRQSYHSRITGNAPCTGHSACDALITGRARVEATPALCANHPEAALIHEAAIGRIAGEQIIKLRTLGLTRQEAEEEIIKGFLGTAP